MERIYPFAVRNEFVFNASPRDFTVEEIPLYDFSGEGEHIVVKIRKKELTTWEALDIFSSYLGIKRRQIGYAGLKDKHAMTIQHLSFPRAYEAALMRFSHEKIKVLDMRAHTNKLRIGHLKGNRFFMRLKKVTGVRKTKLDEMLKWVERNGMPNYFGHQRFGVGGGNWQEGMKLIEGSRKMRDRKTREFLIGAYQSKSFNDWLAFRLNVSALAQEFGYKEIERLLDLPVETLRGIDRQPHFFKTLAGEVMMHYPYGKLFFADEENLQKEAERFVSRDIAPTGLIPGKKVKRAENAARTIESRFDAKIDQQGARRYAWVWPEAIETRYVEEKAQYELRFSLPKGSYATVLLETLQGGRFQ